MDKFDRLVWAEEICWTILGVSIGLRANIPGVLAEVIDQLPGGSFTSSVVTADRHYSFVVGPQSRRLNQRSFHFLFRDVRGMARSLNLEDLWEALESDSSSYIAQAAKSWLFVHAGVVGWRGSAIVIPGRSFSGKTTLVKELIQAGASYYSDEFAVLDRKGFVHPFPRSLSIRDASGPASRRINAQSLGAKIGIKPLPVKLILATHYEQKAQWRPRSLSSGEGALVLLAHTLGARSRPGQALDTLQTVMSKAQTLQSPRGEAAELVDEILLRTPGPL
jgi:hypothetical protein